MRLHVGGNAIAGAQWAIGQAHDGNRFALLEQLADLVGCGCVHALTPKKQHSMRSMGLGKRFVFGGHNATGYFSEWLKIQG
jgi:hypothetical protein